jgi:hypothetical protein
MANVDNYVWAGSPRWTPTNQPPVELAYGTAMSFAELANGGQPPIQKSIITKGLWADNLGELLTFYTSSTQWSGSTSYYYEVWSSGSNDCGDENMFSIAYGHHDGLGARSAGGQLSDTPSKAIYGQYRSILLDGTPSTGSALGRPTKFTLGNTAQTEIDHFYAINFNRARFKDKLDPGNFQITLVELSGSGKINSVHTGSAVQPSGSAPKIITLIDDSGESDDINYEGIPLPVRNLVSGTIDGGVYNPSAPHYYGLVYPDNAVVLIDAQKLNLSCSFNTVTGSNIAGDNSMKLFTSISGAAAIYGENYGFLARSVEMKETAYYYVRVYPGSANYTSNPTFVSGSENKLVNTRMEKDPKVYITSIGLYNNMGELMAVAKMSKPIEKSFNSELSVTVKLEY